MLWEKAKRELDNMDFPNDLDFGDGNHLVERHSYGKEKHNLETYTKELQSIRNFSVFAKYNVCPECSSGNRAEIMNKRITILNDKNNLAYTKWFTKHGKSM